MTKLLSIKYKLRDYIKYKKQYTIRNLEKNSMYSIKMILRG